MDLEKAKFIVASGPVIIENDKVLLNRHGKDAEAQKYWKFVGGQVSDFDFADEINALENACKREVKEEMGIDVEIIMPLKPLMVKAPDRENTIVILVHYLAKCIGEIKPGTDILEWKWFDLDALPDNLAPNIMPVLEEYKKFKKNYSI